MTFSNYLSTTEEPMPRLYFIFFFFLLMMLTYVLGLSVLTLGHSSIPADLLVSVLFDHPNKSARTTIGALPFLREGSQQMLLGEQAKQRLSFHTPSGLHEINNQQGIQKANPHKEIQSESSHLAPCQPITSSASRTGGGPCALHDTHTHTHTE